jgi:hypothetical protein
MLPQPVESASPKVAIASTNWYGGTPDPEPSTAFDEYEDELDSANTTPERSLDGIEDSVASSSAPVSATSPPMSASAPSSSSSDFMASENDDDLIVIEEPQERIVNLPIGPQPAAKRQEYRQLFAQLRRG